MTRPLTHALGEAMTGNFKEAREALSAFDSMHQSIFEGLAVAKKSLMSPEPVVEGSKFVDFGEQSARELQTLKKLAGNGAEKNAAQMMTWYHGFAHSPWVTWPGRGLQAGDDLFKTMTARMQMRFEANAEFNRIQGLDDAALKELGVTRKTKNELYKEILEKKIGPNGEILDSDLLKTAKEATFQTPLEGTMKSIAGDINKYPIIKQFVPFLQTPWNVAVYGAQHIPGVARFTTEYKQVMQFGTPQQKAIMRGREALGGMFISMAVPMVMADNLTGNGPADPELRALWRRTHEPMSIRLPNGEWMSYKSLAGLDLLLPLVADTVQIAKMLPEGEGDKLFAQFAYMIANTVANKAYFQGFVELSGVLDPASYTLDGTAKAAAERFGAGFIGNQGAMRQLANALKDGVTEYRDGLSEMMGNMTGGLLGDKIPVMDVLTGEQQLTGAEGILNSFNPFRITRKDASPLANKLAEVQYEFPRTFVQVVDGTELTPEQEQFIRKEMYAGGAFPKAIEAYLKSKKFQKRYEFWQNNRGTADHVERKQSEWYGDITEILTFYKKKAVRELA